MSDTSKLSETKLKGYCLQNSYRGYKVLNTYMTMTLKFHSDLILVIQKTLTNSKEHSTNSQEQQQEQQQEQNQMRIRLKHPISVGLALLFV